MIASQLPTLWLTGIANKQSSEPAFASVSHPVLHESPAELYMVGMLSMMDRMLNIPMKRLLELISVDSHIQEALLGSAKGLGRALELCRYHEQGGDSQGLIHPDAFVHDCFAEVGQVGAQFKHSGGVDCETRDTAAAYYFGDFLHGQLLVVIQGKNQLIPL